MIRLQRSLAVYHRGRPVVVFDACRKLVGTQEHAVARVHAEVVESRLIAELLGVGRKQKGVGAQPAEQALGCFPIFIGGETRCRVLGLVEGFVVLIAQVVGDVAGMNRHNPTFFCPMRIAVRNESGQPDLRFRFGQFCNTFRRKDLLVIRRPSELLAVSRRCGQHNVCIDISRHRDGLQCSFFHTLFQEGDASAVVVDAVGVEHSLEAAYHHFIKLQTFYFKTLVDESVAIDCEQFIPFVIVNGCVEKSHFRHVRLAVGSSAVNLPGIRGAEHVLAAIVLVANLHVGLQCLLVDTVFQIPHLQHCSTVVVGIKAPVQQEGETISVFLLSFLPRVDDIWAIGRHSYSRRTATEGSQRWESI